MLDRATLRAYLARAETNIAEGEPRLTRQIACVERLRLARRDTQRSEVLLNQMAGTLAAWQVSRAQLLASLAQLEAANSR